MGVDVFMACFDFLRRFRLNACIVSFFNISRFFIRMHIFIFLRNSTEFYGICIYEEILYENACFPVFFNGILRNPTEFAFMKRFFMRMHVFLFFTEFYGICIYEEILYQNACFPYGILRNLHL